MRALDTVREVYGVRRITFNEAERVVRVEFDASRFKEPVIAGLLRRSGLDLGDQLVLAEMALRPKLKLSPIDLLSPIGFGVEDESEEQPFGEGGGLFPLKNAR